jgi:hypothetical protein|tara:strand:- start:39 stop:263 length:225 start_codon:yes stop_codon:yes gene_type:complete
MPEALAEAHGAAYYETSAKTGVGVDEAFVALARVVLERMRALAAEDEEYEAEQEGVRIGGEDNGRGGCAAWQCG